MSLVTSPAISDRWKIHSRISQPNLWKYFCSILPVHGVWLPARLSASWWQMTIGNNIILVIVGKWAASVSICYIHLFLNVVCRDKDRIYISLGKFVRRNKMASFCSSLMRSDLLKVRIRCLPSQWEELFDSPSICEGRRSIDHPKDNFRLINFEGTLTYPDWSSDNFWSILKGTLYT